MKKAIYAAVAATIAAGSAVAHPGPEAHICGVDPASVSEWPGYGTRDNIYDRGDYFFAVEVENFSPSISYKHWNKVEAITLHHRVNKETCAVSTIEIVHPESEPEVIPAPVTTPDPAPTPDPVQAWTNPISYDARTNNDRPYIMPLEDRLRVFGANGKYIERDYVTADRTYNGQTYSFNERDWFVEYAETFNNALQNGTSVIDYQGYSEFAAGVAGTVDKHYASDSEAEGFYQGNFSSSHPSTVEYTQ